MSGHRPAAAYRPPSSRKAHAAPSGEPDARSVRNHISKLSGDLSAALGGYVAEDAASRKSVDDVVHRIAEMKIDKGKGMHLANEVGQLWTLVLTSSRIRFSLAATEDLCRFFLSAADAQQLALTSIEADSTVSMALQYLIDRREAESTTTDWAGAVVVLRALRTVLSRFPQSARYGVWIIKVLLSYCNVKPTAPPADLIDSASVQIENSIFDLQIETSRLISQVLGLLTTATDASVAAADAGAVAPPSPGKWRNSERTASRPERSHDRLLSLFRNGLGDASSSVDETDGAAAYHWTGFRSAVLWRLNSDFATESYWDEQIRNSLMGPCLYEIVDSVMMRCAECMVKILHASIHSFTKVIMEPRNCGQGENRLINSLDWVSTVAAAVRMGIMFDKHNSSLHRDLADDDMLPSAVRPTALVFTPHAPSLIIALRTMFQRIVPGFLNEIEALKRSNHAGSYTIVPAGAMDDERYFYSQVGFVCASLNLLGSVASSNPGDFLRHWPLFLTDSALVDNCLSEYVSWNSPLRTDSVNPQTQATCPKFQSTVYRALLLGLSGIKIGGSSSFGSITKHTGSNKYQYGASMVRSAASQAIRCLVRGLPLRKWFVLTGSGPSNSSVMATQNQSQRTVDAVIKLIQVMHVAMLQEDDELTLVNHFDAIRVLITQLPLSTLYSMDDRGVVKPGATAVSASLERTMFGLFACILRMSLLEGKLPPVLAKVVADQAPMEAEARSESADGVMNSRALITLVQELEPNVVPAHGLEKVWPMGIVDGSLTDVYEVVAAGVSVSTSVGADSKNKGVKHRCSQALQFLTELACDISAPLTALADASRRTEVIGFEGSHALLYVDKSLQLCAGICGLTPIPKGPPDVATSYGLSLKTLIINLVQSCGSRFLDVSGEKFLNYLWTIHLNASSALRILAMQLVGLVLNACNITSSDDTASEYSCASVEFQWNLYSAPAPIFRDPSPADSSSRLQRYNPKIHDIATPHVGVLLRVLLHGCRDDDHLVRGHAASNIGLLGTNCWMVLKKENRAGTSAGEKSRKSTDDRTVLAALLKLCSDSIGTVRTLAHKALGEVVLAGALHLSSVVAKGADILVEEVLVTIRTGCGDSKLSVRMQALWSLGNFLLLVLPYRLVTISHDLLCAPTSPHFPTYDGSLAAPADCTWMHVDIWKTLSELCTNVIHDSDKMISSMTRCLGMLAAGLVDDHRSCVLLTNVLIQQVLLDKTAREYPVDIAMPVSTIELTQAVQSRTQKLLMALSSGLGLIGWVLIPLLTSEVSALQRDAYISIIRSVCSVQCCLMKHSGDNVRLQATRSLVAMAYADARAPSILFSHEIYGSDMQISLLGAVLSGMAQIRTSSGSKIKKSKPKKPKVKAGNDVGLADTHGSPAGRKLIITKPAPPQSGGSYISKRGRGLSFSGGQRRDIPSAPAETEVLDAKGITSKMFKPLAKAITNAITTRRRPEAQDVERNLLRLYLVLLWTLTSNRTNASIPDSAHSSSESKLQFPEESRKGEEEEFINFADSTIDKLEVLMEDSVPMTEALFELNPSPLLAAPATTRERLLKGYTVAPNTLAADCARYFLQLVSAVSTEMRSSSGDMSAQRIMLETAEDRLSWLAAADVKYFIIPGASVDTEGDASAAVSYPTDAAVDSVSGVFDHIQSKTISEAYLYDEDEI